MLTDEIRWMVLKVFDWQWVVEASASGGRGGFVCVIRVIAREFGDTHMSASVRSPLHQSSYFTQAKSAKCER